MAGGVTSEAGFFWKDPDVPEVTVWSPHNGELAAIAISALSTQEARNQVVAGAVQISKYTVPCTELNITLPDGSSRLTGRVDVHAGGHLQVVCPSVVSIVET